jgi:hypothetical protein
MRFATGDGSRSTPALFEPRVSVLGAGRHSWLRIEVNEFPICTQQRPAYSDIVERFHGSVPFRSGLSTDGPAIRTGLHQILE